MMSNIRRTYEDDQLCMGARNKAHWEGYRILLSQCECLFVISRTDDFRVKESDQ